ncbi:efflux RND transporter periplasmic adaptor subunit [Anthocerotibacter panamensis]|uniref:efflux RND transporter periplasmic adaptor subunit n=1 Tax=Anthocerotibacter panamensis TaxID=2857077 RepID=UPI001C401558|nr:efflux RND transporter periplasmic adaptor subunit [Anthocerotibacter panamensis]
MLHPLPKSLLGFALLLTACQTTPAPEEAPAPVVQVPMTRVQRIDLVSTISIPGTVVALPDRSLKISPAVAGKLVAVLAVPGQQVHQGQLLARLDSRQATDQLNQSAAQVQSAQAGVAQANTNVLLARNTQSRLQALYQQKIAAQKDLIAAQSQVQTAEAQRAAAEAQLRQAQAARAQTSTQLGLTRLDSPLTGVVARRFLNVGDTADPTTPVVQVVDLGTVLVSANLPADTPSVIRPGQSARIQSVGLGNVTLAGTVTAVSPVVDAQSNTLAIQIRVANPRGQLKENQTVTVAITTGIHKGARTVPATALVPDPNNPEGKMVYTVRAGHAQRVAVKTGLEQAERVEILTGLEAGTAIVARGAYGLPDDTAVQSPTSPKPTPTKVSNP